MKHIVCLSATPWQTVPTRTQRFLDSFSDTRILFFEPGRPSSAQHKGKKVGPMTYLYTLPYTPAMSDEFPRLSFLQHRRVLHIILDAIHNMEFHQPLLWVCSPFYDEFLEEIPRSGLIYDCDQDWSELPIQLESQLTCRADIVFAASAGLREHLSPCNDNIFVVPNGFDFARFDALSTDQLECPIDLQYLRQPVLGYVGTIWQNLNLTPIATAAAAHPRWSFVLIGRISRRNPYAAQLHQLPNVHFLGQKPAQQIPAYLRHMQVGISLLRDGMEDNDVLSPRIYEYFAQGLPVVAMYHHLQREVYPTLIDSAYSDTRFTEMCEKVLTQDPTEKKVARYHVARDSDWSNRCAVVTQAIRDSKLLDEMDLRQAPQKSVRWFD